jgi:hypothetical protein
MKRFFAYTAMCGAILAASAIPSSAATITLVGFSGSGMFASQTFPFEIDGGVLSSSKLSYKTDFVEFTVSPTTATTSVVDVLNNAKNHPSFPGETYRITSGSPTGPIVDGPFPVTSSSNTPEVVTLTAGVDYFLELNSGKPPLGVGNSQFQLTVVPTTPIPGSLVLFCSVLAGAGLLLKRSWRDRQLPFAV